MALSLEEAQGFIASAKKARENWLTGAKMSWDELKRLGAGRRANYSVTPNSIKKFKRYPAWYAIFKIRQPLLLSRIGVPIGKDTFQDGADGIAETAALCKERLAKNLAKSFDFFDVMAACRDDGLATNLAQCRLYYKRDEVKEPVQIRLTAQQVDPQTNPEGVAFYDEEGDEIDVEGQVVKKDEQGFFIETDEVVDVENEKICVEPVLYKNFLVDPETTRWGRVRRIAFIERYSERAFKEKFGAEAWMDVTTSPARRDEDDSKKKDDSIDVYEYWDDFEKEVYWFTDYSSAFIKPKGYEIPDETDFKEVFGSNNGLYDLYDFFPCPKPFILNAPTDSFFPVTEFEQVVSITEDIHRIFSRMIALTRSIRARLLFDSSVDGLQPALNEATEGDAFGIDNLAHSLASGGGTLDRFVQYIPVAPMIEALGNMYTALEQRLNLLYKLTGTSDLLQGLVTDPTQRTFGERQQMEKYALNQLAEPQRKMQEFVRETYDLMCEMALKNFKDQSLDRYIVPSTLPQEHQQNYRQAIEMLKSDMKRFRVDLETDSTIAINERYEKEMAKELVNTLTAAIEKVANVAKQEPGLIQIELHALKYIIAKHAQGKIFQGEITQAIDNVIKSYEAQQEAAANEQPFDKAKADHQLALEKFKFEVNKFMREQGFDEFEGVENLKLEAEDIRRLKTKDALDGQLKVIESQLEQSKAGVEMQNKIDDNERLTMQMFFEAQKPAQIAQAPEPIIVPQMQPFPVPQPIIVPQQQQPQAMVIQPVEEVPVEVPVPVPIM